MKCLSFSVGLVLMALAAALCLAQSATAGTPVPHKESADGQTVLVINPTLQNPLGTFQWTAQGIATQMGKYTEIGSHNFTAPNAQGVGLVLNGTFTSTAADGSTISGTYSGTYKILGGNQVSYSVTVVWLTGTGRLAGVTGRSPVTALLNTTTGKFHFDGVGTWILP